MKTRLIITAGVTVLLFCAHSCSLKEERRSFANRESSYNTIFQMRSVVNSCYMPLKAIFISSFGMGMEAATDLWYDNTSIADAICDLSPTKPGIGSTVWTQCYKGIMYCNEAIECMQRNSSVPVGDKGPYIGECITLRALYYYYLTCTFNGVPFYTYMVEDMGTLEKIRRLPRTDADTIRETLYTDLRDNALPYFTRANGYYARTSEIDGNRAGAPLALHLMAKFMMWNKDWDRAVEALGQLEGIYGTLTEAAYPLEDTWWSKKNTAESIFEIQHAWSADGIQYYSSYCRVMYPQVTDQTLDGIKMLWWGTEMTNHSVFRCTARYAHWLPAKGVQKVDDGKKSLFDPLPLTYGEYQPEWGRYSAVLDMDAIRTGIIRGRKIDRRSLHVLGLGDLWGYGEYAAAPSADDRTFLQVRKNGRPYAGPKFWVPGLVGNNDGNNYKIFRYADAVLMQAECWCMKDELDKAAACLACIRERAGVSPLSAESREEMLSLIQDERARELGGEMHRRYDLVRWGIWYDMVVKYNTGDIKNFVKPCHEYYPIPDKQCALSGYILDNPEYKDITDSGDASGEQED